MRQTFLQPDVLHRSRPIECLSQTLPGVPRGCGVFFLAVQMLQQISSVRNSLFFSLREMKHGQEIKGHHTERNTAWSCGQSLDKPGVVLRCGSAAPLTSPSVGSALHEPPPRPPAAQQSQMFDFNGGSFTDTGGSKFETCSQRC